MPSRSKIAGPPVVVRRVLAGFKHGFRALASAALRSSTRRGLTLSVLGALTIGILPILPASAPHHVHVAATPTASGGWLDRLNTWRANAGLPSLSENPTWSQGDYNHSLYMVKNDEVAHQEISTHPYYTAAGDAAARNSNIYISSYTGTTDENAIDWWMQAPFHAMGMMDPRLTQTGFGSYRESKPGWDMGATLDVIRGNSFSGGQYPVYFPGNNLTEPLTTYGGYEYPDPLQACPGYGAPTGLPVFVQVGGNVATNAGPVHSFTGNGVALAHCVIDSHSPSMGNLAYRGGVILVPRQPLQWGVKYVVALTVNGAPYTWSFTVGTLTGGTWSASFDMSKVPTKWTQGVSQTFPITVTNTGNVTWASTGYFEVDLDLHFATSSGGSTNQANWLTSLALPPGADVGPGGSATVTFTLTAPAGSTVLEALMIKEHQFWFDKVTATPTQWVATPVAVIGQAAVWSASFDMSTVPTTWAQGVSQTFSINVTNTGNVTWPSTGYNEVDLDLHFATSPGGSANVAQWLSSQALALSADVAPGGSATVTFTLTEPTGSTVLEALMIKEHQFWFDTVTASPQQWAPVTLNAPSGWSASFDMSTVPTMWAPGVSQTFTVKVTNTGNVTWPSTGYNEVDLDLHFATSPGGSANVAQWLSSQALALGADVAPSGSATVTFALTAPAGSKVLEALMIKEHQFWFDVKTSSPQQWAPVTVTMSQAIYDLSSTPTSWTAGQSKTFSVKVSNTSDITWISTGYYEFDLDFHFTTVTGGSAQQASWLTSRAYSLPNDVVPGASVTFTVTVTAPSTTGSMFLEAEMIKEHAYWFRDVSSVAVTVG